MTTAPTAATKDEGFRYDGRTIALHWATALLVALLWCLGQSIDWFPKGMPRIGARSTHILLGALLALVLAYRIWWRRTQGLQLPAAERTPAQIMAGRLHIVLYLLLALTVLLGFANVWTRGDNIFGLFKVPQFEPGNRDLVEQVEDIHALLANIIAGAAVLHAATAIYHYRILRDGVLQRMLRR